MFRLALSLMLRLALSLMVVAAVSKALVQLSGGLQLQSWGSSFEPPLPTDLALMWAIASCTSLPPTHIENKSPSNHIISYIRHQCAQAHFVQYNLVNCSTSAW